MNKLLSKTKYVVFGLTFIITGFMQMHSASASTNIYYNCSDGGVITTVVNINPTGPFPAGGTGTSFTTDAYVSMSTCSANRTMNLSAQNNSGASVTLIPDSIITPGGTLGPYPNAATFTSPNTAGTYAVHYVVGVDEPGEPIAPMCIPSNTFTFVNMGPRWGKITTAAGAQLPKTIVVNLYGDALGNIPANQLNGTVTFDIPNQPNRHSYHNGMDCDAYGCEITGTAGYNHGVIQNQICTGGGGYGGGFVTCFIADTQVTMADGSKKNIQDVKIGDVLKGETTYNTVLGFHQPKLGNQKLYSFNGGKHFVTAEHPFATTDGWKSLNPEKTAEENLNITVTKLKVGDTLITDSGLVKLYSIDGDDSDSNTQLYNFILDGDHTYYADGYLVHNKVGCSADGSGAPSFPQCPSNLPCIDSSPAPSGAYAYPPTTSNFGTCALPCNTPESNPSAYCATHTTFCASDLAYHNCP